MVGTGFMEESGVMEPIGQGIRRIICKHIETAEAHSRGSVGENDVIQVVSPQEREAGLQPGGLTAAEPSGTWWRMLIRASKLGF